MKVSRSHGEKERVAAKAKAPIFADTMGLAKLV